MNNYAWLFMGFMFGIIVSIIIMMACNCKIVRRNRGSMIVPRRTLQTNQIIAVPSDSDISDYSISIDEETKEEIHVRVAENV